MLAKMMGALIAVLNENISSTCGTYTVETTADSTNPLNSMASNTVSIQFGITDCFQDSTHRGVMNSLQPWDVPANMMSVAMSKCASASRTKSTDKDCMIFVLSKNVGMPSARQMSAVTSR